MNKKEFRKNAIKERDVTQSKEEKSKLISEKLFELDCYIKAKSIFCYASYKSEVNTDEIILNSLNHGKKVALPRVVGDRMEFYYIECFEDVEEGYMGIREPKKHCKMAIPDKDTMVIVPGTSFDMNFNRNGYGGGFYDRFLSQNEAAIRVGICFDGQIYSEIPHEAFDIKMDAIVSESKSVFRERAQ